jgi:hypothetical protein
MPNLPVGVPMFCLNPVDVIFLLARQSHQAPRSITVPVLQMVGIVRVHFLYLNPKICKYQILVLTSSISCRKRYAYQWF